MSAETIRRSLRVSIHDYWHCGSGRGVGSHVDARVDLDPNELPYVPGRSLKGLLRDALLLLEAQDGAAPAWADRLFGSAPAGEQATRHDSTPGLLAVSDARLPPALAAWLASETGRPHRRSLFRRLASTAIDPDTGAARDRSLRGIEVVVPLELECELHGPAELAWPAALERAFPLVRAVGAHRHRGFGRCTLTWMDC